MKLSYRLLITGFLASGLAAVGCVSGDTVGGGGGRTGSGSGGRIGGSLGGTNGGSLGGFTGGSLGGFTGGSLGGFTGGSLGGFTGGSLGGTTGGAGSTGFVANCVPAAPLVSNMEDGLFYFGMSCPKGAWHLTTGGGGTTSIPPGDITPVAITDRPPSTKAIHVSGAGQANSGPTAYDGFVSLSASLNSPSATQTGSVNAASFTGVRFWGKISGPIEFHVPNVNTHPAGGLCTVAGGLPTSCYGDAEVKLLAPSTTWTLYTIPFSTLVPAGFGNPPGTPFPADKIFTLEWHTTVPATGPTPAWDIWIDDLTFY